MAGDTADRRILLRLLGGTNDRITAVALVGSIVLSLGILIAGLGPRFWLVDGGRFEWATGIEGIISYVIFASLVALLVGPVYAALNGGPALSFSIPVLPLLWAWLLIGGVHVDIDFGVGLAAATAAATIGTARTAAIDPSPAQRRAVEYGLGLSAFGVVLTAVTLWRLSGRLGPYAEWAWWLATLVLIGTTLMLAGLTALFLTGSEE